MRTTGVRTKSGNMVFHDGDSFRQRAIALAQTTTAPHALTPIGAPTRTRTRMPINAALPSSVSPAPSGATTPLAGWRGAFNTPLSVDASTVRRPPPPVPVHGGGSRHTGMSQNDTPSGPTAVPADVSGASSVMLRLQDQLELMMRRTGSPSSTTARLESTRRFLATTTSNDTHHDNVAGSNASATLGSGRHRTIVNPQHHHQQQQQQQQQPNRSATGPQHFGVPQTAIPGSSRLDVDNHHHYHQQGAWGGVASTPLMRVGGGGSSSSENRMTLHMSNVHGNRATVQQQQQHNPQPYRFTSQQLFERNIDEGSIEVVASTPPPPQQHRGESIPLLSPESDTEDHRDAPHHQDNRNHDRLGGDGSGTHAVVNPATNPYHSDGNGYPRSASGQVTHTIHVRQPATMHDISLHHGGAAAPLSAGRSMSATSAAPAAPQLPSSTSEAVASLPPGSSRVAVAVSQRILDLEAAVTALQSTLVRRHATVSVEVDKAKRVVDHAEYRLNELSGNIEASTNALMERIQSRVKTQTQLRENQADQWRSTMLNSIRGIPTEIRREAAKTVSGGTAATVNDIHIRVDALMTSLDQYKTQNELRTTSMLHRFMDLQRRVRDQISAVRVASNLAVSSNTTSLTPSGAANGLNKSHQQQHAVDVSPLRARLGLLSTSPVAAGVGDVMRSIDKSASSGTAPPSSLSTKSMQSMHKMLYQFVQQTRSQLDELRRDRRAFEEHFIARVAAMNNSP
jgi:hypothetical protein